MISPSNICALSSAFRSSNLVLLTTTSCLKSTKLEIKLFRFRSSGLPFTRHMLLTENEVCRAVYLYNLFNTTFAIASRFISKTMRIPFRSDSSLKSEIPSIFLSLTNSAVLRIKSALFTWYGISLTIMVSLPLTSSISALPLITTRPLPVKKASLTPS